MAKAPHPTGWLHDPAEVERVVGSLPRPFFAAAAPNLAGSGAGQTTLLYNAWQDVNGGHYVNYPAQTIGDCVSHGTGHGIDLLSAVEIVIGKQAETFHQTATEAIYGMAREYGNYLQPPGERTDGAVGAWAAAVVSQVGTVSRDVTGPYDGRRAGEWGWHGVPNEIKQKAREHPVKTVSLVTTYAELEDALANGYPITVCSNQGFTLQRDGQGFCQADPRHPWGHCMLIVGTRTDRPGACIFQSWGMSVPSGPLALDQPPNSFWVDRPVVERMLAVRDSWALSNFLGYESQPLPSHWTYGGFA